MDFFSGAGSGLISGGLSMLGGMMSNAQNMAFTREQMQWQEKMRATQYQTAVKDLQKAGLNPMLAYTQGGAGVPSIPTTHLEDAVSKGVSSGWQAANAVQALDNAKAVENNTVADTANKVAQNASINQDTALKAMQTLLTEGQLGLTSAQQHKTDVDRKLGENELENWQTRFRASMDSISAQIRQSLSSAAQSQAMVQKLGTENQLLGYDVPGARNKAASDSTWYGEHVRPYMGDIQKGVSAASDVVRIVKRPPPPPRPPNINITNRIPQRY